MSSKSIFKTVFKCSNYSIYGCPIRFICYFCLAWVLFPFDWCLLDAALLSNMTMAHSWNCRWYQCLKHQPVALEVSHRGETYSMNPCPPHTLEDFQAMTHSWRPRLIWVTTSIIGAFMSSGVCRTILHILSKI